MHYIRLNSCICAIQAITLQWIHLIPGRNSFFIVLIFFQVHNNEKRICLILWNTFATYWNKSQSISFSSDWEHMHIFTFYLTWFLESGHIFYWEFWGLFINVGNKNCFYYTVFTEKHSYISFFLASIFF